MLLNRQLIDQYMNIAFTITDNYTPFCGVALCSLLENNKNIHFNVYIVVDNISETNKEMLIKQGEKYHATIEIVYLKKSQIEHIQHIASLYNGQYNKSVLCRLYLSSLIDVDEILYLDSDLIVSQNIGSIDKIGKDYSLKAVADLFRMSDYHRLHLDHTKHVYFNSGVLFINLKYWREKSIEKKIVEWLETNTGNVWLFDQDALNAVLAGTVDYLHPRYNCMSLMFAKDSYLCNRIWYKDLKEVKEATKNPAIIHFVGQKPWQLGGYLPHREDWMKYYEMSMWNGLVKFTYPNGFRGRIRYYLKTCLQKSFPCIAKRYISNIYN